MTDELEQMSPNQRRALDKSLSALETFATIWAAEIRLGAMSAHIAAVANEAERAKRIAAMIEQGFIEGAYRHYLDHKDKCDELEAARATAEQRDSEPLTREQILDLCCEFGQDFINGHCTDVWGLLIHLYGLERALKSQQDAAEQSRDRLLAALERASRAESALRALADECDNEMTLGWEERIRARIDEANILLAGISSQQDAAIESRSGDGS